MRKELHHTMHDTTQCWYKNHCERYGSDTCNWSCKHMQETKYMLDLSELPLKYRVHQDIDMSRLNEQARSYVYEMTRDLSFYVKHGFSAYFYGDVGTGKTSWAVYALTNYFSQISEHSYHQCRGLYIAVPKLLRDIRLNMTYKDDNFYELICEIPKVDFVVWDDVYQTGPTDFEKQWLFSLIDERIANGKSSIFTSNHSPESLGRIDERLYSRICANSDCVAFIGDDLRGRYKFTDFLKEEQSYINSQSDDDVISSSNEDITTT